MSLHEGIVPLQWKEANKSVYYRLVSLTSVFCKLLVTIIMDHMKDFLIEHKLTNPYQYALVFQKQGNAYQICYGFFWRKLLLVG